MSGAPGGAGDFAHLHVHSELSTLDGTARLAALAARAYELGQESLALTDHGNLFGVVQFVAACKEAGVRPIIGMEGYTALYDTVAQQRVEKNTGNHHLTLLVADETGYKNLLQLSSYASTAGFYRKPLVDWEHLTRYHQGLIVLSGCLAGEIPQLLVAGNDEEAYRVAGRYRDLLGDRFYIELHDHVIPEEQAIAPKLAALARHLGTKLVAANDAHYVRVEDAVAHDAWLAIQTGKKIDDPDRGLKFNGPHYYLKSGEEMRAALPDFPEAVTNTLDVADRCRYFPTFDRVQLPRFPLPAGETDIGHLRGLVFAGLDRRFGPGYDPRLAERAEYELGVIERTGFPAYFLIVADYVNWARDNGIMAMPRGSVAGSLCIHALGICDINPMPADLGGMNLMFERFLHEERIGMPDIDMDFSKSRRKEVIRYVQRTYGHDKVGQIVTFQTAQARKIVRDVGRSLGLEYLLCDRLAKAIPVGATIEEAEALSEDFRVLSVEPGVPELLDLARALEGLVRNASTHAAGIVITRDPLPEHVPVQRPTSLKEEDEGDVDQDVPAAQWPMADVEKAGLLKADFLGLENFDFIQMCCRLIAERGGQAPDFGAFTAADYDYASPEAQKAYDLIGRGETEAVFQASSAGMTGAMVEVQPRSLLDVCATIALFRPGPMANLPRYVANKRLAEQGGRPEPIDPLLEPLLGETYQVITYQDDVLRVLREVAGYSWGEADVLRKAMGKKSVTLMAQQESVFRAKMAQRGHKMALADRLWGLIGPFAGYGFPKGHAAAYAVVCFQTAYLKANHPLEYLTAVLSCEAESGKNAAADKVRAAIGECKRYDLPVLPPDANVSRWEATIEPVPVTEENPTGEAIRLGLAVVKGVGQAAARAIEAGRRGRAAQPICQGDGPFDSVEELVRRIDLPAVDARELQQLAKAGALDSLAGGDPEARSRLHDLAPGALFRARRYLSRGGKPLRRRTDYVAPAPPRGADREGPSGLPWEEDPLSPFGGDVAPPWGDDEQCEREKEALGFYLTSRPLTRYEWFLEHGTTTAAQLDAVGDGLRARVGGLVAAVRKIMTKPKNGREPAPMAFVTLKDVRDEEIEVTFFPREWAAGGTSRVITAGASVLIDGRVQFRNGKNSLLASGAQRLGEDHVVYAPRPTAGPEPVAPPMLHTEREEPAMPTPPAPEPRPTPPTPQPQPAPPAKPDAAALLGAWIRLIHHADYRPGDATLVIEAGGERVECEGFREDDLADLAARTGGIVRAA